MIYFSGQSDVEQVAVEMPSWEICKREEERFNTTKGYSAFCVDRRAVPVAPELNCSNGWCCWTRPGQESLGHRGCYRDRESSE